MKRLVFFLVVGLGGAAVLISLGVWQVQRLTWKQNTLSQIEAQMDAAPLEYADVATQQAGHAIPRYQPLSVTGQFGAGYVRALVSRKDMGVGYRIIAPLKVENHTPIMVDLGFIRKRDADTFSIPENGAVITVVGNSDAPIETDKYTPAADIKNNVWFARDVTAMANHLNTDTILVVARNNPLSDPILSPWPVDTGNIPNNHLQYAITWFSIAFLWLSMTAYYLSRPQGRTQSIPDTRDTP